MFTFLQNKHRSTDNITLETKPPNVPRDLFFMNQYIPNTSGTIALIHSIANNKE